MPELLNVGGQAVIEGVMMRGPRSMIIAVRKPDGSIVVKDGEWIPLVDRLPLFKLPFLRGAMVMVEAMVNGVQALSFSANAALGTEAQPQEGDRKAAREAALSASAIAFSLVAAMAMGAGLFIYAPHFLASLALNVASGQPLLAEADLGNPAFHGLVGLIKMAIFVGYILLISRLPDIRRVFQYHGAEHKSIFTYEAGEELTVENARRHSREHKRCGTSFLLYVVVVSILVYAFLGWQTLWVRILTRLALVPVIAGLAYEFIRFAGRSRHPLVHLLSRPGMWLQGLTTREPDDAQLEVSIAALQAARGFGLPG